VPVGRLMDQGKKGLVQKKIPMMDDLRRVAFQGQPITGGFGKQVACPDVGFDPLAPTAGERAYPSGLSQPSSRLALGGRALVGEEGDEATLSESFVRGANACLIVEDGRLMEGPHMVQEHLPGALVRGPRHPKGVFAEVVENAGKPLPISVVHGKEKGGLAASGPWIRSVPKRREIQLAPPAGNEKETFLERMAKQAARERGGGSADPTGEGGNLFGAGDR